MMRAPLELKKTELKSSDTNNILNALPIELLFMLFEKMDLLSLLALATTCRNYNNLIHLQPLSQKESLTTSLKKNLINRYIPLPSSKVLIDKRFQDDLAELDFFKEYKKLIGINPRRTMELLLACASGDVSSVRSLLELGVLPFHIHKSTLKYVCDQHGNTALHWAARNGRLAVIELLVAHYKEFVQVKRLKMEIQFWQVQNNNGENALHLAASGGRVDVIRYFLSGNQPMLQIESTDNHGQTPLFLAAAANELPAVEQLLSFRANVQCQLKPDYFGKCMSLVSFVACFGKREVLERLLIALPESLNQVDQYNKTPIIYAFKNRDPEVAFSLLQRADLDFSLEVHAKLLMLAVKSEHSPSVKILLDSGTFTLTLDEYQKTVLQVAIENDIEILKLLLKNDRIKKTINQVEEFGETPLMTAVAKGKSGAIPLLCQNGANVNQVCHNGTALYTAVQAGNFDCSKALLEHGADINLPFKGATPHELAIHSFNINLIKLFREHAKKHRGAGVCAKYNENVKLFLILEKFERDFAVSYTSETKAQKLIQTLLTNFLEAGHIDYFVVYIQGILSGNAFGFDYENTKLLQAFFYAYTAQYRFLKYGYQSLLSLIDKIELGKHLPNLEVQNNKHYLCQVALRKLQIELEKDSVSIYNTQCYTFLSLEKLCNIVEMLYMQFGDNPEVIDKLITAINASITLVNSHENHLYNERSIQACRQVAKEYLTDYLELQARLQDGHEPFEVLQALLSLMKKVSALVEDSEDSSELDDINLRKEPGIVPKLTEQLMTEFSKMFNNTAKTEYETVTESVADDLLVDLVAAMRCFENEVYNRLPKKEQIPKPKMAELCGSVGLFKAHDSDEDNASIASVKSDVTSSSNSSSSSGISDLEDESDQEDDTNKRPNL